MVKLLQLYHEGKSYQEIGDEFGISRQRVQQILAIKGLHRREKKYRKTSPRPTEKYVARILRKRGHSVKHMPYNYRFDLLVDGYLGVEVKRRTKTSKEERFSGKKKYFYDSYMCTIFDWTFDFLIYVVGPKKKRTHYIFNSGELGRIRTLRVPKEPSRNNSASRGKEAWSKLPEPLKKTGRKIMINT